MHFKTVFKWFPVLLFFSSSYGVAVEVVESEVLETAKVSTHAEKIGNLSHSEALEYWKDGENYLKDIRAAEAFILKKLLKGLFQEGVFRGEEGESNAFLIHAMLSWAVIAYQRAHHDLYKIDTKAPVVYMAESYEDTESSFKWKCVSLSSEEMLRICQKRRERISWKEINDSSQLSLRYGLYVYPYPLLGSAAFFSGDVCVLSPYLSEESEPFLKEISSFKPFEKIPLKPFPSKIRTSHKSIFRLFKRKSSAEEVLKFIVPDVDNTCHFMYEIVKKAYCPESLFRKIFYRGLYKEQLTRSVEDVLCQKTTERIDIKKFKSPEAFRSAEAAMEKIFFVNLLKGFERYIKDVSEFSKESVRLKEMNACFYEYFKPLSYKLKDQKVLWKTFFLKKYRSESKYSVEHLFQVLEDFFDVYDQPHTLDNCSS